MRLRNSDGVAVDPVPVLIVTAMAFLLCFSFGPIYATALGASRGVAVAASGVTFVGATAVAYHRLVRGYDPEVRAPAEDRLRTLFYFAAAFAGLLVLLALPLL